ncbi:hypothetical protein GCM10010421_08940 [Streptomyces glaucus]|uniref:Uncharacterized protein n=1 Tax=Streptomyces glaucus TaxID=284029 RepID=A0ABN3JAD7_9ACTN
MCSRLPETTGVTARAAETCGFPPALWHGWQLKPACAVARRADVQRSKDKQDTMTARGSLNEFCWMDLKVRDPSGTAAFLSEALG